MNDLQKLMKDYAIEIVHTEEYHLLVGNSIQGDCLDITTFKWTLRQIFGKLPNDFDKDLNDQMQELRRTI